MLLKKLFCCNASRCAVRLDILSTDHLIPGSKPYGIETAEATSLTDGTLLLEYFFVTIHTTYSFSVMRRAFFYPFFPSGKVYLQLDWTHA